MGNIISSGSTNFKGNIKEHIEEVYKQVLSPEHIADTIRGDYCQKLEQAIENDVSSRYDMPVLNVEAQKYMVSITGKQKDELCKNLAEYYVKKINLIGTIINCVRLAHLKLDRIKSGGMCHKPTGVSKLPIETTMPFSIGKNVDPILLDADYLQNRKAILKKAGINDTNLLETLAFIEIDNRQDCQKNGGIWLDTRELKPLSAKEKENWNKKIIQLETDIYQNIGALVSDLDLLVEERVEPKMINGKEERVRIYRDRQILDKDLDSLILKTKGQILKLFQDLDSYFIVQFSLKKD